MARQNKARTRAVRVAAAVLIVAASVGAGSVCLAPTGLFAADEAGQAVASITDTEAANASATSTDETGAATTDATETAGTAETAPAEATEPAKAAATDAQASTQADVHYIVRFDMQDPAGGLSDFGVDVTLGKTLNEVIAAEAADLFPVGTTEMFGDGTYHTLQGWESSIPLDKKLEASDFTESNGTFNIWVYAKWSGVSSIIFASNTTDIPANGKVDLACIDAWQAFCDRVGGQYPIGLDRAELNAAQQQSFTTYAPDQQALAILDVAFDEYLTDGSDGTIDVAKHDLATSDGVTFNLTLFGLEEELGLSDLNGVYVMRIPENGGEPEYLSTTVDSNGRLVIKGMTATGTYVLSSLKYVAEPWDENNELLPYTINNGVMTFPGHPELGEWYQLTVKTEDGVTFSAPSGSSAWTMMIDAHSLDPSDPLYNSGHNSGIYFVRGDGQGASANLWVEYPAEKALSYALAPAAGTLNRKGGPNSLNINLTAPATLTLGTSTETVISNAQGATLTHTVSGKVDADGFGDDAVWSMLTLVTDWIGGDAAETAGDAINTAVAGVKAMYVYDIHLEDWAGNEFAVPEGDRVTVTLPIPEGMSAENLFVFHVADDGTVTDMHATVDAEAGTVSFETTHFSTFVLANVEPGSGSVGAGAAGTPTGTLAQTGDLSLLAGAGAATVALAGGCLIAVGKRKQR
ncbi:hypothetical protein B5G20_03580 [Collinsella sp. An7]|uniref:hypothetical protein n=1 Tax=Collinsella sp. An7 TaxID=1965651 RepID=UPI000B37FA15|nr:hypothetical protein [Collinsella sp. An7]OUN47805.1 hypothetical protein B5G20_03580 [Collinsella sp. An7]